MVHLLKSFMRDESGATAIEYGMIVGLVGLAVLTAVKSAGTKLSSQFSKVATNLN